MTSPSQTGQSLAFPYAYGKWQKHGQQNMWPQQVKTNSFVMEKHMFNKKRNLLCYWLLQQKQTSHFSISNPFLPLHFKYQQYGTRIRLQNPNGIGGFLHFHTFSCVCSYIHTYTVQPMIGLRNASLRNPKPWKTKNLKTLNPRI